MDIQKEQELANYEGEYKVISCKEALENSKNQKESNYHFDSKIPALDELIDGFESGELIIVSGPTKNGKTALCQTFTINLEREGTKCLWFEFEVPERQFLKQFKDLPLFYLPKSLKHKDIDWIKDRILEGIIKYNTRVVFIDHLHYLIDLYTKNASMDIGKAIRDLKRFAVENDIVIFSMAHMTKTKPGEALSEYSIRDSSFISQEADSTMIIQREAKIKRKEGSEYLDYTGKTFLTVLNHRRTGTMGKRIELIFKDGYLSEMSYAKEEVENTYEQEKPPIDFFH